MQMARRARPLISAIVPVYNAERYLADALDSVLGQSYRPVELIVVDDGSTDRSGEVARAFGDRIRYYYQPHGGSGAARNAGVGLAAGTYFAFLDADDLWAKDKLERQMEALQADGSLDTVFGQVQQFVSPEVPDALRTRLRCPRGKMPGRLPSTMLVRRNAFFQVGYFDAAIGEAVDWILRATELGLKSAMLPDIVLRRRLHSANSALFSRGVGKEYAKYLKASLDRRRNRDGRHD